MFMKAALSLAQHKIGGCAETEFPEFKLYEEAVENNNIFANVNWGGDYAEGLKVVCTTIREKGICCIR